ncbi:MAG: hypothetical protein KF685_00555 [Acidobacteria bacterium]|nr:hypothetical protein [Acidobacteriota bacterium]
MTQKSTVEPSTWNDFLTEFSERNKGRRARFELFGQGGSVREESQEGHFEKATLGGRTVTVIRSYESQGIKKSMEDEIKDVHGVEVQFDTDGSEDTIEFMNHNGDKTVLRFESLVDGSS